MKVTVIGANGQLGSDLVAAFSEKGDVVSALTHNDMEISDLPSVSRVLGDIRPQVIVNTAAMHQSRIASANRRKRLPSMRWGQGTWPSWRGIWMRFCCT